MMHHSASTCEWPIDGAPSCMKRLPEGSAYLVRVAFVHEGLTTHMDVVFCAEHAEMARLGRRRD